MKKSFINKAIDLILPPRCLVTGEIVTDQGALSAPGWQSLTFISAPFCPSCGVPFDFDPGTLGGVAARCVDCLDSPPPFTSARAPLVYDEGSRSLILKFKHGDHLHAVPTLVPMMRRAGAEMLIVCDALVPVPLHRWRFLKRRYNQSALLAMALGKAEGKPVYLDALIRTRSTPPQGHKRARDRAKNVKDAFAIHPRHDAAKTIAGRNFVLVDDVFTTGSTVRECAKTLLAAGAARVDVLAIARVKRT